LDLGPAENATNDLSLGLLNEIGLDMRTYALDAPLGLMSGENMFQEFLSGEQWKTPFVNFG
jgi:hypothetical protein